MIRWLAFFVVLGLLLGSAIGVVALRHESRQVFAALQQAASARDQARAEWSRLQLEQAVLAESGRVERQAREQLGMSLPATTGILLEAP
ncbi:MAG: cell division protein FtsL [Wenzhouxiangella sp.]